MLSSLKFAIKRLPIIHDLVAERDKLLSEVEALKRFAPPGHFFSPIPSLDEIRKDESRIFESVPRDIIGVELHESQQLTLLEEIAHYYKEMPFQPHKVDGLRYYFENPAYLYSDAIILHGMIRHLSPKRIIEVGSGFSSCVTLDTNELFFNNSISTTFIEPYPHLLMSLVKANDKERIRLLHDRLQDVDVREFEALQANDILFIDSTHVSKVNSDVNRIFFEILRAFLPESISTSTTFFIRLSIQRSGCMKGGLGMKPTCCERFSSTTLHFVLFS